MLILILLCDNLIIDIRKTNFTSQLRISNRSDFHLFLNIIIIDDSLEILVQRIPY